MQVFRSEIKVGLLIVVALVILGAGIFIASDLRNVFEDKKEIVVLFAYADGITAGSPVWYAGYEVGEVTDIRIAEGATDRIAIQVKIDPKARVRTDSRVDIRSLGMMGAKYVEITPGSPDSPELAAGATLEGQRPSSIAEIIESGGQVATRLVTLVDETRALIHQLRTESSLIEALQNSNAFLADLREQGKELGPIVKKISRFTDTLNQTGDHLAKASGEGSKELTALLSELRDTNRGLQKRIESVETHLSKTLVQIGKGVSEAEGTVQGVRSVVTASEQDIVQLMRHLRETSRHLESLSEDLRAHPWKVIWKEDGTHDMTMPPGTEQWREKGRIGPHGKE